MDPVSGGRPQAFTTIGRVVSDAPYQVEQSAGFSPYRVDVDYLVDAAPAPIHPLLDRLDMTRERGANWGIVMRGAKRKLSEGDMAAIADAMGVDGAVQSSAD